MPARIQLKMDAEFPFSQRLLDLIYPYWAIASSRHHGPKAALAGRASVASEFPTARAPACARASFEFRTAHDVTIWPVQLTEAAT